MRKKKRTYLTLKLPIKGDIVKVAHKNIMTVAFRRTRVEVTTHKGLCIRGTLL